jgi:hypothetical protein
MLMRKTVLSSLAVLSAAAMLHACGGGDGGPAPESTTTVSAYVTDDLGGYDSVVLTVNSVQLRHPAGRNCEIIKGPLVVDAAELGRDQLVEFVDTTTCEAGPYNRMYVELGEDVLLRQAPGSPVLACKFASFFDSDFPVPNHLACANSACALNITGAVNLVARSHEHVALDVDLKKFLVDESVTPCTVTLKVSPLHAQEKLAVGYRKSLSGKVSSLDIAADRFVLTTPKGHSYAVSYVGVTDQAGLDTLLGRAATDGLRTAVRCESIDAATTPPTCTVQSLAAHPLKAVTVKAKGKVADLDSGASTMTLAYGAGATLPVNYAKAAVDGAVDGTLANDAVAEVSLYGFVAPDFLAREVEVE